MHSHVINSVVEQECNYKDIDNTCLDLKNNTIPMEGGRTKIRVPHRKERNSNSDTGM